TIRDVLGGELDYISSESGAYDASKRQVEWTVPVLAPGDTLRVELVVRISTSAKPGLVGNTAIVLNSNGDLEDSDSAFLDLNEDIRIRLDVDKYILGGEVRIGNEYRYGILIKNTGTLSLNNLVITDTLSSDLVYKSASIAPSTTANGIILWKLTNLEVGDSIVIEVLVSLQYSENLVGNQIVNSVSVSTGNNGQIWSDEISSLILPPNQTELIISKTLIQELVGVGDLITYDLKIKNIGKFTAFGVLVKDFYPEGLQYVGMKGPGIVQANADSLLIEVGKMLPGEEITIQLSFILLQFNEGMINSAEVGSDNSPDETDKSGPIKLKQVELEIFKSVSSKIVEVGSEFSYSIRVVNNSQIGATGVLITDILPVEVEYIKHENTLGIFTYSIAERKVEWMLESLGALESADLKIFVKAVKEADQVINEATITSVEEDLDEENNKDVVVHLQVKLHFPNIFTPNGDGINDLWTITGLELIPNNSIQIVNRWGSLIFNSEPYNNNWTGDNLVEGAYFFMFKWKDNNQKVYEKTGFIHLVR
ncbi:MAG: gliding motility-associated C-terminal domain-containing protein, partial [Algoriphagus sp.]|uniref:T9SS type B sorting domain-containing protein n=1 Tax=Algoriphagus sp. TaxID=1872435 RepID=UPI00273253D5